VGRTKKGAPLNSAMMLDPEGRVLDEYDKINLVPFGEFVPEVFSFVNRVTKEAGDFAAGTITADLTGTASNASELETDTWEAPGTIGSGTPNTGAFTTLAAGATTITPGAGLDAITISNSNVGTNDITDGATWSIDQVGDITSSGNISATGTGTITSAGTLTASSGLTVTTGGAAITAGGVTVTAGNTVLSYNGTVSLAGGTTAIPNGVSVVVLTGAVATTDITAPTGTNGQIMYIYNNSGFATDAGDSGTFAAIPNGTTWTFVYAGGTWQHAQ